MVSLNRSTLALGNPWETEEEGGGKLIVEQKSKSSGSETSEKYPIRSILLIEVSFTKSAQENHRR